MNPGLRRPRKPANQPTRLRVDVCSVEAMSSPAATSIVWLRDDLRLDDNPALTRAAELGLPLTVVYILDEESDGIRPLGGAVRWWLHHSLASLAADLEHAGSTLVLRRGPATRIIRDLVNETGASHVLWNRRYGGPERAVDAGIKEWAAGAGIEAASFQASLLFEPWTITTGSGGPYKVFTPFWRACLASGEPRLPLDAPSRLPSPAQAGRKSMPTVNRWRPGLCCRIRPTGAEAWRKPGNQAKPARTAAWRTSWMGRWRTTEPAGTCPASREPAGCPPTSASARSARSACGMRSVCGFRARRLPTSEFSGPRLAGGNSAGNCST